MNTDIRKKLNTMALYKDKLKDVFVWDNGAVKYVAAIIYSSLGKEIDTVKLDEMRRLINDNTGRFSAFRNSFQPVLSVLLSFEKEPKEIFLNMKDIARLLKQEKIAGNAYTAAVCYYIVKNVSKENYKDVVSRFKFVYKSIKKEYPLITGVEDYLYFAMLAMGAFDLENAVKTITDIYNKFQVCEMSKNEIQTLAIVTFLIGRHDDDFVNKAIDMDTILRNKGVLLNSFGMSASVAILSELNQSNRDTADTFLETVAYIKTLDGYSDEYIDDVMRNIIAALFLTYGSGHKMLIETQTLCYIVLMMSCSSTTLFL